MKPKEKYDSKYYCPSCGCPIAPELVGVCVCGCCGKKYDPKDDVLWPIMTKYSSMENAAETASACAKLHNAMLGLNQDARSCMDAAYEVKTYLPNDFYAEVVIDLNMKDGKKDLNKLLCTATRDNMLPYADFVAEYMIRHMTLEICAVTSMFIDRAYKDQSGDPYNEYLGMYEESAKKLDGDILNVEKSRDVFISYAGKDYDKVAELCDFLESRGISCFVAIRNMVHGFSSEAKFVEELHKAIKVCKTVVFISTENSRSSHCIAYKKELLYAKQIGKKMIQYLLGEFTGKLELDSEISEIFEGQTWRSTLADVENQVLIYLEDIDDELNEKRHTDVAEDGQKIGEHILTAKREDTEVEIKPSSGLEYEEREDAVYVTGIGVCRDAQVVIPDKCDGKPVRGIDSCAFYGNTQIKAVIISSGVESIGPSAFENCRYLRIAFIPKSIKQIRANAFRNCGTHIPIKDNEENKHILIVYGGSPKKMNELLGNNLPGSDTDPFKNSPYAFSFYARAGAPEKFSCLWNHEHRYEKIDYWHYDDDGNPESL